MSLFLKQVDLKMQTETLPDTCTPGTENPGKSFNLTRVEKGKNLDL